MRFVASTKPEAWSTNGCGWVRRIDLNFHGERGWIVVRQESLACLVDESSTMLIARSTYSEPSVHRSNPLFGAWVIESVSRSASEPVIGLVTSIYDHGQPPTLGEACNLRISNERLRAEGGPGWLGTARGERHVRNLGDPFRRLRANGSNESISSGWPSRKSDALIVAMKGVTILERRGATVVSDRLKHGVPLG